MVARALALFVGLFLLANLVGEVVRGGFDETVVLVDLRGGSFVLTRVVLFVAAGLLAAFGFFPDPGRFRRAATTGAVGLLAFAALANIATFYGHLARGTLEPAVPVPLSLLVLAGLLVVLRAAARSGSRSPAHLPATLAGAAALFLAFPLLLMMFFGPTDYRRAADAAVVFGARAYADGSPSRALADRVRTGVVLWREGLVPRLVFSGGPGDGSVHETEAMRRLAVSLGVPEEAILLDRDGLCTAATARNLRRIAGVQGFERILAVSHAFHLPRIKMAFRREGLEVCTVPAVQTRPLTRMPYLMAREVAAYWAYWLSGAL